MTDALRLTAAYTYTDAKTNDTGSGDRRASLIPRHQASFWGNYKVQQGVASGLELGTGVRYIGSSVGIGAVNADYTPIYGSAEVPAHTVWDAMIGYDFARTGVPSSTSTTCWVKPTWPVVTTTATTASRAA